MPGSRSAGRVQSVALRLICEREEEIEIFNSREYWDIKLGFKTKKDEEFIARLTYVNGRKLEQFDLVTEAEAKKISDQLGSKSYSVVKIEKKQSRRNPQPPFTTSSLQQEASRKLGFGAKKTMQVAQKLYEGIELDGDTVGLITYMRTDGVTVSQDAINATREAIAKKYGQQYVPEKQRFYQTKAKNAQEAHEAIRPTDVYRYPESVSRYLDEDQKRLYELIWKRMVASQMESAVLDQVAADIHSNDNFAIVRANGSSINFDGFYVLYREGRDDDKDDDENRILPHLDEGDKLALTEVNPEQHFTQPPPRYTEASLVKKLEELGIGRPSTYASIISVLQDREYVLLDKKRFMAEDRGRLVTAFLMGFFKRYVEYDFTAKLEEDLDHVSAGDIDWKKLLRDFWGDFHANIDSVKEFTITDVIGELNKLLGNYIFPKNEKGEIDRHCPKCSKGELSLKMGRNGSFIGCSAYPDCNYTKSLGGGNDSEAGGAMAEGENRKIGVHPDSGLEILLKKGPYGPYLQLGEDNDKEKPKRASIPKTIALDTIDLPKAVALLSLPRRVGIHPETGKVINAGIGMYGPYLLHATKYTSLKNDDVLTIGINRAVDLIAESGKGKSVEPLRIVGKHPETGEDIAVYDGKYGPYVKHQKVNASVPRDISVDEVTVEQAKEWLEKQAAKKGFKGGKGGAKAKAKKPAKKKSKKEE